MLWQSPFDVVPVVQIVAARAYTHEQQMGENLSTKQIVDLGTLGVALE